jgi:hypothetical protein
MKITDVIEPSIKITDVNQLLSTTPPQQALAPNEQTHEISNRESRHIEHEKKANDSGWKPNKHAVQKLRVKTHQQDRGASKQFGDGRRDAANRADF